MATQTFRQAIESLYPELGREAPDPDLYAESIIVRVLNSGPNSLREDMVEYYGTDRVGEVARARADRLDAPVYRAWKDRFQLPERNAVVERLHRLWIQ